MRVVFSPYLRRFGLRKAPVFGEINIKPLTTEGVAGGGEAVVERRCAAAPLLLMCRRSCRHASAARNTKPNLDATRSGVGSLLPCSEGEGTVERGLSSPR